MFMFKRDTCTLKLKDILDHKTMEECEKLIKNVIESRHKRVLERQKAQVWSFTPAQDRWLLKQGVLHRP